MDRKNTSRTITNWKYNINQEKLGKQIKKTFQQSKMLL